MEKSLTLRNRSTPIPLTYNQNSNQPETVDYEEVPQDAEKRGMSKKTKLLIGGLFLGALGFSAWAYFRWRGQQNSAARNAGSGNELTDNSSGADTITDKILAPVKTQPSGSSTYTPSAPKVPSSDFPLKKGSRGEKVKQLQQAMISKFGTGILPKYGADGQFGSELETALKAKGIPTVIDETTWNVLSKVDTTDLATKIYNAAKDKNFAAAYPLLKQIQTVQDYKTISEQVKAKPNLTKFYNNSLVNTMYAQFTDPTQKQQMELEFGRMGLKYDGSKWSIPEGVSGLPVRQLITTRPTKVWIKASHPVSVGANTIVGTESASGNGITVFDTVDGFRMYVMTAHVRYV